MNHPSDEQLVLYHYGEAGDRSQVAEHLAGCDLCRANYAALQRVLAAVDAMPLPQRADNYGPEVWRQLRPQIARRPHSVRTDFWRWIPWPRWAVAGALVLLAGAAFFAGRWWPHRPPDTGPVLTQAPQSLSAGARERVLLAEIGDHLERSQLALIELLNSKTNGPVDLSAEQVLARELAAVNRLFRRAAADAGEPGVARVLEALERTLVEVANGPASLSAEEFAALRERLDTDGLLFKVKVLGAQVRTRERDAARELAAHRS